MIIFPEVIVLLTPFGFKTLTAAEYALVDEDVSPPPLLLTSELLKPLQLAL
jgi:hypothetical protein